MESSCEVQRFKIQGSRFMGSRFRVPKRQNSMLDPGCPMLV